MTPAEQANFIVNIVIALGTVGAVIVALFGERIKRILLRADLSAEILDERGELTNWTSNTPFQISGRDIERPQGISGYGGPIMATQSGRSGLSATSGTSGGGGGRRVIYYHLRIVNNKPTITVEKCRVLLREIYKRNIAGQFERLPLMVPPSFSWAPAESSPPAIDFITDQVLDFGYIAEDFQIFMPAVVPQFNNFRGALRANETMRYVIEILSNNSTPRRFTIEVSWNGTWDPDPNIMGPGFRIQII